VYQSLAKDATGGAIPIDVVYEGTIIQATLAKDGAYHHTIKLEAPNAFSLMKTVIDTPAARLVSPAGASADLVLCAARLHGGTARRLSGNHSPSC